jgi:hypothetical protein
MAAASPPSPLVWSVEITEHSDGGGWRLPRAGVYSTKWSIDRIRHAIRELMEWQIVIELAGGVASDLLW